MHGYNKGAQVLIKPHHVTKFQGKDEPFGTSEFL